MPSMSYCMFENTSTELSQVLAAMEDAPDITELDLNQYERPYLDVMAEQCRMFLQEYKRLQAADLDRTLQEAGVDLYDRDDV